MQQSTPGPGVAHITGPGPGDGWFYDFGDSNRAFKRDCTVYTGY